MAFLDVLRGLAALAVFYAHAGSALSAAFEQSLTNHFEIGQLGVVLFFLCSGFIIPRSLENQGSLIPFWIRRICRLYPLYWLSIVAVVMCYALGLLSYTRYTRIAFQAGDMYTLRTLLSNAAMLQSFFGEPHLITLYWTLTVELVFYLLVSLLFLVGVRKSAVLPAVTCAILSMLTWLPIPLPDAAASLWSLGIVLLLDSLAIMWTGTVLSGMLRGTVTPLRAVLVTLWTLIAVAVPPSGAGLLQLIRLDLPYASPRLVAFGIFALVLAVRTHITSRTFRWFGEVSYSLYLMHPLVIALVPETQHPVLTIGVWFVVLVPLSAITYRWIELPGIALGRRLTGSVRAESAQETHARCSLTEPK